jgi:two-component system sensor histidine kinase/response regulator
VEVADNGRIAVDMARRGAYDLILMDMQMPEMDGLEATRLIRSDVQHARLPVIAMTAHAMAGDRDKSRAAGMNDHVSKPFEPAQLFEVMLRWLSPVVSREAAVAGEAISAAPAGPTLDTELGLRRCLSRPELYQKILGRYLKQRAATGNEIRTALGAGAMEAGARAAHTLISTASMIGAPTLADLARELHDAIDLGSSERWPDLLDRIDDVQREIDTGVTEYMASHQRATG